MEKVLLETERCSLRQFELSDAEALYQLNLDPEVMQFTGDVPFASVDEARDFVKNYDAYEKTSFGRWAVVRKSDKAFLGWCGLKQHAEYVDLGFRFSKKYWGNGYASESAQGALLLAKDKFALKELIGRCAKQNLASIRVLEKLGFQYWKHAACEGITESLYYRLPL